MKKATNKKLTTEYLANRAKQSIKAGYGKQKWVIFCEVMMAYGCHISLYEARKTVSKYVTVKKLGSDKTFTVRFSNHKPIFTRELKDDCDFFVGHTNLGVTNTDQAITACRYALNIPDNVFMDNFFNLGDKNENNN